MKKLTTKEFISKAIKVHGLRYDYSKVDYKNSQTKVCIICPEHGEFWQKPNNHLNGRNCFKCKGSEKSTTEKFIEKANKIHNNKYDYSKVQYINNETKVCIICPKHGEFWQEPKNHLNGQGCPKCKSEKNKERCNKGIEQFIKEAKEIHGDKYDYSKVNYINTNEKVCIICPEHGEFWQTPSSHINQKRGCPVCGRKSSNIAKMLTNKEFIEKATLIHNGRYSYEKINYQGYEIPIEINCPVHGNFWQTPDSHLQGKGCQKCSISLSRAEDEICYFLKELDIEYEQRNRSLIYPYEIDIYIPSLKIGIEYNGLLWHSQKYNKDKNYHLNKTESCKKQGIKLIQIFEDEYLNHKNIVLNKLKHILKKDDLPKIMGRKCVVKEISNKESKIFLNQNHIQGFAASSVYLGCFYENVLMGVMTFKKEKYIWELNRFASNINYNCIGIGGKLFKYFVTHYNPVEIKSFADRRWTINEDNLYTKLGFNLDSIIPPDYRYYWPNHAMERIHKFNYRKNTLHKKYGLPLTMTEHEMTDALKIYKIYDCGLYKYVWKKIKEGC